MTSFALRQSFLDFFREKEHSIVPSSSLLPDSPNLLFTNAGMNQFVPIFLGKAQCPYDPPRAANSQKCIRAGGKHNDLEDVGLDTYHHTFFEMLGNWSFGDYFKKEAILWAWELLVSRWKFPANRLYATVYSPEEGDPSVFDEEAYAIWKVVFESAKLDPEVHIIKCGRKDNFWMMGDTGPCGPCSEIHMDLTPQGNSGGRLVNQGTPLCIEIWNLVFIQFNANPGGSFTPLPARHVDTGMGFERVCAIVQGTKGFRDFSQPVSNYNTDLFTPIFKALEDLSGYNYRRSTPAIGTTGVEPHEKVDIAFRVVADHIRTLGMAIADGIRPSNEGRGYVLRRILRRAVRYGRVLGINKPFLHHLVGVVAGSLGHVYTDIEREHLQVDNIISAEEEAFGKTIERGLRYFDETAARMIAEKRTQVSGEEVFQLYDTHGFPEDLTQLMARERGFTVDLDGFAERMQGQRLRSQLAQKKEVISLEAQEKVQEPTLFLGYEALSCTATVLLAEGTTLVTDQTVFYAEMGGQLGDTGTVEVEGRSYNVVDTQRSPRGVVAHKLAQTAEIAVGAKVTLKVDATRRERISKHHTATHLLHWALREVLGPGVQQRGSQVGPDRLRFDFSHGQPVTQQELAKVQELMVAKTEEAPSITTVERPYAEVRNDPTIIQAFADKYGDTVRVVSIGDFSRELCGGTHANELKDVGFVKVILETSVAAGVRRIEAVGAEALTEHVLAELPKQDERWASLRKRNPAVEELPAFHLSPAPRQNWQQLLKRQEQLIILESQVRAFEKEEARKREVILTRKAEEDAEAAIHEARMHGDIPFLTVFCGENPASYLPYLSDAIRKKWKGVAVLASVDGKRAAVLVSVHDDFAQLVHAGRIVEGLAPMISGKGGGKSTLAQASGDDPSKLMAMLKAVPDHIFN